MQKGRIKMVVLYWDFDGTLVHSDPLWTKSAYKALKSVDADTDITFEQLRPYMAHGFPWHTYGEDHTDAVEEKWWLRMNAHFYQAYLSLNVPSEIAGMAVEHIRDIILSPNSYCLYKDAIFTLQTLKTIGCKNVVLSNNHPDLKYIMDGLGISAYFDDFIISGRIGYDKPRPEIYEIAKGLYPNADAYFMIGDSLIADVQGGNENGMKTILVHNGFHAEAAYCFDDLCEIISLFI